MLKYNMDILEKSAWLVATPNDTALTLPFICSEAGDFYALKNFYTERDSKDSYWLVYTLSGEGVLLYNGASLSLTENTCAIINSRAYQKYCTAKGSEDWHHYWVHIDGEGVKSLESIINMGQTSGFTLEKEEVKPLFKTIFAHIKQNTITDSLTISIAIHNILQLLSAQKLGGEEKQNERQDDILYIASYIRKHYTQPLKVDELADKIHLSKFYFIKLFSLYIGTTPYDYLLHYRITKAKELLCSTQWTSGNIGLHVGFASESNFTAQFKRIASQSPNKYRKEHYLK